MKVLNRSRELVEKAKMKQCPRCKGIGHVFSADYTCYLCGGYGSLWISDSGWARKKYSEIDQSTLYPI